MTKTEDFYASAASAHIYCPNHSKTNTVFTSSKHGPSNIALVQRLNQQFKPHCTKNIWNLPLACKCNAWGLAFARVSAAIRSLALAWWSVNSLDLQINNSVPPPPAAWQWNISICLLTLEVLVFMRGAGLHRVPDTRWVALPLAQVIIIVNSERMFRRTLRQMQHDKSSPGTSYGMISDSF